MAKVGWNFASRDVRESAIFSCHLMVQDPGIIQFVRLPPPPPQEFLFKETQLSDLSLLLETYELSLLTLVICLTL